jgi:D-sedoheptulose 7-phosphate isomerase
LAATAEEVIAMPLSAIPAVTLDDLFERRTIAARDFVDQAENVANACHAMASRFHRGGKLVVFGNGGPSTDAQHVAVEFMHPVIVGKRALPAVSLAADVATLTGVANQSGLAEVFAHQIRLLADQADIALGISSDGNCENVRRGLEVAHDLGMLTVALVGGEGGALARAPRVDHVLRAGAEDVLVVKEVHVTAYHVLWELVHVLFDQPGLLDAGAVA